MKRRRCLDTGVPLLAFVVSGVEAGNGGAADVVPHAKDSAWDGGHGVGGKVEGGQ